MLQAKSSTLPGSFGVDGQVTSATTVISPANTAVTFACSRVLPSVLGSCPGLTVPATLGTNEAITLAIADQSVASPGTYKLTVTYGSMSTPAPFYVDVRAQTCSYSAFNLKTVSSTADAADYVLYPVETACEKLQDWVRLGTVSVSRLLMFGAYADFHALLQAAPSSVDKIQLYRGAAAFTVIGPSQETTYELQPTSTAERNAILSAAPKSLGVLNTGGLPIYRLVATPSTATAQSVRVCVIAGTAPAGYTWKLLGAAVRQRNAPAEGFLPLADVTDTNSVTVPDDHTGAYTSALGRVCGRVPANYAVIVPILVAV